MVILRRNASNGIWMRTGVPLLGVMFLFIFGWKITDSLDLISLTSLGLILYESVQLRFQFSRNGIRVIALLWLLLTYALAVTVIASSGDTYMVLRYGRALINLLGGLALIQLYRRTYGDSFAKHIILHLYLVLAFHGLMMLSMYFNGEIRETIYSMTRPLRYVNHNSPFLQGYRIPGLTYGLSQTSVVQMWGLLLFPAVLMLWGNSFWRRLLILLAGPILIGSVLVSGRTGLALLGPIFFIVLIVAYGQMRLPRRLVFRFVSIAMALALTIGTVAVAVAYLEGSNLTYTLNTAEEVLVAITRPGESPTLQILAKMVYVPDRLVDIIFGTSLMDRSALGIETDIGYIRVWFANGLIGILLNVLPFLLGLGASWKIRGRNPHLAGVAFGILLSSLILHGKEVALFTRNQWSIQVLLMEAVFLTSLISPQREQISGHLKFATGFVSRSERVDVGAAVKNG